MDTTTRHHNRHTMLQLIQQYMESNVKQKEFCSTHEISISRFHYWHKRYKEQFDQGGFVPVQIHKGTKKSSGASFEIQYPNGVILRLPPTAPLNLVRSFIVGI